MNTLISHSRASSVRDIKVFTKKGKKMRGWEKRETHHWFDHSEISQIIEKSFCCGVILSRFDAIKKYTSRRIYPCYRIIQGRLRCGYRWMAKFWDVKGSRIPRLPWPRTKQYTPKRALLLVSERQGVFFRRTWGRHIQSLQQLYELFSFSEWTVLHEYSQTQPDLTDLKRMNRLHSGCGPSVLWSVL